MSKVSVFDHGWIDLVFEGRNQSYGAYQLRKQDPKTTLLALITGIGIVVTLIAIPAVISKFRAEPFAPPTLELPKIEVIEIEPFKLPDTPKPKPANDQPAAAAAQSNVPTVAFTPLVAVTQPTTAPPTTAALVNAIPATVTTAGTGTGPSLTTPGTAPSGTGPATTGPATGPGDIETFVDVTPQYPGGLTEFYKAVAKRFEAPELANISTLKVFVSFVVEPDGTLSNIKATKDPGYGMGTEAVRVLKSLKAKWTPGMKNGKAVRTAYSLPITVRVN